jgi:hypothetical protein
MHDNLILWLLLAYFFPTAVAVYRGHQSTLAILLLNTLTAWTGVLWLVAFVWALSGASERTRRREFKATERMISRSIDASRRWR